MKSKTTKKDVSGKKEYKKLTVNQEKFAQNFVLLGVSSDAYRVAYPKSLGWKDSSVNVAASVLMANINVSQRVAELREEQKKVFNITVENVVDDFIFDRTEARKDRNHAAAIKATEMIGKIFGYFEKDNKQKGVGELADAIKSMVLSIDGSSKGLPNV